MLRPDSCSHPGSGTDVNLLKPNGLRIEGTVFSQERKKDGGCFNLVSKKKMRQ